MEKSTPNKILVAAIGGLRESVLATAILRPLKSIYPDTKIGFLIDQSTETMFEDQSMIDAIHSLNLKGKNFSGKLDELKRVIKEIKDEQYDQVYFANRKILSKFISFTARVPKRIGNQSGIGRIFLTNSASWKGYVRRYLPDMKNLLETVHDEPLEENLFKPRVEPSIYEQKWAESWIEKNKWKNKTLAVISPYFGQEKVSWDAQLWFKFIRAILKKKSKLRVVVLAASEHHYQISQELSLIGEEGWRVLSLPNGLMKGMVNSSTLFIGANPGQCQLSLALGKPTISIADRPTDQRFISVGHAKAKALVISVSQETVEKTVEDFLKNEKLILG